MAWQARSFTQIWMLDTPMISAVGPCLPHHRAQRVGPQTPRRHTKADNAMALGPERVT